MEKKKQTGKPWMFRGIAPKRNVASARTSLFGGRNVPRTSGKTPAGFKKVELYMRVAPVGSVKKIQPKQKSWEQQALDF